MKITNVEVIVLRQSTIELIGDGSQDTALILVSTDTGITGIGEVDSNPYVVKAIVESPASHMACLGLGDVLIGQNPLEIGKLWNLMYEKSIYYGRRSAAIHAMSGIDIALWDIMGKALGLPVSVLLGGRYREKIRAYCSVLMPEDESGIRALVDRHMPKGYLGLKLGWGALGQSFEKDVHLARCARRAIGDDAALMLDIGMLWTDAKGALSACRAFEDLNIFWVEEPFSPDRLDSYAQLRAATRVRIAGGEEVGTIHEYRDLLDRRCVDVVQPDLSRCGGFSVARQLADLCAVSGEVIVPHAFKTGILMAASLHYIASLQNAPFLEFCEQDTALRRELTNPVFVIDPEGFVSIPDGPGLGIELNMDAVNRYRVNA